MPSLEKKPLTFVRQSITDQVRQTLLTRILDGTYKPGDCLKERALAREFGLSQAPVRDALGHLKAANIVETIPYKGTHVRLVNEVELQHAYRVRARLEELAGELAALKFKGDTAELKVHAEAVAKANKAGDMRKFAEHNYPFHRAIVERCEDRILLRLWDQLHFELRTSMYLVRSSVPLIHQVKDHFKIIEALNRGNGVEAGRLLRQHSEFFVKRLDRATKCSG